LGLYLASLTDRLTTEVEADGDHVAVVIEFLVYNVMVSRLNVLQSNVSLCTVDRDSVAEKELETSSSMEA
jgi:hypothetical protein